MSPHWLCAQLGAREHYAVARALHQSGKLRALLTDAWIAPDSLLGTLHRKLSDRHHSDLAAASVTSWNADLIAFELAARAKRLSGWALTLARNRWFQQKIVNELSAISPSSQPTLFAYSYAALGPLKLARERGWRTVLGQIDPGPVEERLVGRIQRENVALGSRWTPAPADYWETWRQECALADRIVVNSSWSRAALIEEGIPGDKIEIVPLAYETPPEAARFQRAYPRAFSGVRPLRVLFLGQVNLRKGMAALLGAMRLLAQSPIEFSIVGPAEIEIPTDLQSHPHVRWIGPVPRSATAEHYRRADVFLFPTHSDGFGLTQLEAQAWKLPVIASRFCGDVVEHGKNGWLLPEVTADAIAERLADCLRHPKKLAEAIPTASGDYSLSAIGASLIRSAGEESPDRSAPALVSHA